MRFIYSSRAIAILLKYFIFLRFAQLDVRPALDSAEAIQDRMKVQSKNTNTCRHRCFYHVPQSKGCLVEVQGRVAGDHASWAGGESVRSHLSPSTP